MTKLVLYVDMYLLLRLRWGTKLVVFVYMCSLLRLREERSWLICLYVSSAHNKIVTKRLYMWFLLLKYNRVLFYLYISLNAYIYFFYFSFLFFILILSYLYSLSFIYIYKKELKTILFLIKERKTGTKRKKVYSNKHFFLF